MSTCETRLRLHPIGDFHTESIGYPKEVHRLVAVAHDAGYALATQDAHGIWRHYSSGLCAHWLCSENWSDEALLDTLLANSVAGPDVPAPTGYASWLDYAVATMQPPNDHPLDRPLEVAQARAAAQAELEVLRRSVALGRESEGWG
jgi:hypothetical protein